MIVTPRWMAKQDFMLEYMDTEGFWQKVDPCLKILKQACKWPGLYKKAFLFSYTLKKSYTFQIVKKGKKTMAEIEEIKE